MPKLLITGSRDWTEYGVILEAIRNSGCTIVIRGNARGADTLGKTAALALRYEHRAYPAKWDVHGKAAGPIRNQEMLDKEHTHDHPIELCLAFPLAQSRGTYDMMRRAHKAGIQVIVYRVGGTFDTWSPTRGTE